MASSNCSPKQCILAIDDEAGFLAFLKAGLEGIGYTVHTAASPQKAINLYANKWQDIGMVFLDFLLPEMSGDLVFDELQRLNPDVRVVLLTGCEVPAIDKLFQKGLRGCLQKPFSLQDLVQRVQIAVSTPHLQHARHSPLPRDPDCENSTRLLVAAGRSAGSAGKLDTHLRSMTGDPVSNQRHLPDPEKSQSTEFRILDIFFKCGSCGRHLVADDAGAGQTIDCPDCNTPTTIPEIATTGKCPRCRYRLKFSPEMKEELVHCPACHLEVRLPGQHFPKICPKCGTGWNPPLHRCQCCSYSLDNPVVPTLIPD